MGYEMVKNSPPTRLEMQKSKTRLFTLDDTNYYRSVHILLKETIKNQVRADFEFIRYGGGLWSEKSKQELNGVLQSISSEAQKRFMLQRSNHKKEDVIIHREKIIERQIVKKVSLLWIAK